MIKYENKCGCIEDKRMKEKVKKELKGWDKVHLIQERKKVRRHKS